MLMKNDSSSASAETQTGDADWKKIVVRYQTPSTGRAIWQIVNTLVPYAALWYLMYLSLAVSYWLLVPLAMLAGAFMVRAFIIFHDCGHGSFFKSQRANHIWGAITGVLTFTPYYHWRWEHSIHHSSSGDLDRRGTGDVWTMTVQEYLESSRWRRFSYRMVRNPFILFVIAPLFLFRGLATDSQSQGQPARAAFGVLDESGIARDRGWAALGVWLEGVSFDPVDCVDGGRLFGRVVVLRATSV